MKSGKFLFIAVACVVFFGTFLAVNDSRAADGSCTEESKCCKCFEGALGDDEMTIPTLINAGMDASSATACSTACYTKWQKKATYYTFGGGKFFAVNYNIPIASPDTPGPAITSDVIPGTTEGTSDIVQCGRPGQKMCTICDLIAGLNNVIHYLMKIAIGIALLALAIGGVMYIISAGDKGLVDKGKSTMKNAGIGFVIMFAGYLIINTTIMYIGARTVTDADGSQRATFGMNIISWGKFDCNANPNR